MARTAPVPNIPAIPGMNPGIFVLGGGGDGGGSGAGAGKGKDGKQGANGKNGGNDANGDGKDAKGCGAGTGGACTNCGSNIGKGDPVNVLSGEVYTVPETDLLLRGWFDLEIIRSYSSARNEVDVGLGFGWTHSLAWSIQEMRRNVVLRTGDGAREILPALKEVGEQASVGPWGLLRTEMGYAVRPGNEFIHHFAPSPSDPSLYRLVGVTYRARGSIKLEYDGDRLASATDAAGRQILFRGGRDGRIEAIIVPSPDGQSITFARFEHDARGDLVAAIDADGHATRYAYDDEHRLVRLEYPSGIVFRFTYDDAGRCVETFGEPPGGTDPALAPEAKSVLHDGRPAKGIFHCHFDYGDDYTEVVDSVRLQRFFRGPAAHIAKAVSARGGVTTRTFDDRSRVTSLTDPTGAVWTWQYDDMDTVVAEAGPDGETIGVARDPLGRELQVVDPAGGATSFVRDPNGEVLSVRDQKGATILFGQLDHGVPREMIDERGGKHLFEYNSQGLCTARTFPNGSRYEFTYDYWGRLLQIKNPLGHTTSLRYTSSGLVTHVTDQLGRTTLRRYDGMRNLVSTTAPDGGVTTFEYGGLNWLTRVTHPDGSEVRGFYNREGWLLYIVNERGERSDRTYFEDGNLRSETRFHGATITYERDLLGRIIGYDEGTGAHELKLSPAGNLVEHATEDGASLRYEYDARGEPTLAAFGDVTVAFEVDPTGLVVKETVNVEGRTYVIWSTRDQAGDRRALRTSLGHELSFGRDPNGRVAGIQDRTGRVIDIVRGPVGAIQRVDLPGGAAIVDTRDAANRLRRRQVLEPGEVGPRDQPQWVGKEISRSVDREYEYTAVDELHSRAAGDGAADVFEYDVRKRLVRRHQKGQAPEELHADACSNYSEVGPSAPRRSYSQGNVLSRLGDNEYRYDARGFLIEKKVHPKIGGEPAVWRYGWDGLGQLTQVDRPDGARVEMLYDAFARRVAKRTVRDGRTVERTHYVWDQHSLLHEVKLGDGPEPQAVRTYLFEDHNDPMPLGHRDAGQAGWVYYVEDVIGTPTDLIDAQGKVLGSLQRTLFGEAEPAPGSKDTTLFRYPGQYADPEIGLHYNFYRYYDPEAGRYISPDPIGYWGGLNLFAYCPNPVGWQDLFGLDFAQLTGAPGAFTNFAQGGANPNIRTNGDGDLGYPSGGNFRSPGLNTAPAGENGRNNACGEQKFAQDLLAFGKTAQGQSVPRNKRKYKLEGKRPPCPTCHAALMRAAADTNSTVDYSWEQPEGVQNRVRYKGTSSGTCNVSGQGKAGQDIVKGYDHEMRPTSGSQQSTQGYYGVGFGKQSDQTYAAVEARRKAGQA